MFNKKSHTSQVTPTVASFATGAATTVLTVAATLVSLRSDASREGLFLVLSWTMYAAAAGVALILAWVLSGAIRDNVRKLDHLAELEKHVSRLIRIRRRSELVQINAEGDALVHCELEVESAPDISFPWLTIPIFAGASPTAPEWQGATIHRITVDGIEYDPDLSF